MAGVSDYTQPPATRRPLKVFAFDPMLGRRPGGRIIVDIPNEENLKHGPLGERIQVIDYDGANNCFYTPVGLNDTAILMQGGLEPTESDPRFHQQMVYAVAMKVLENFDTALGRRLRFRRNRPLRIFPHAFQGANAFYDPNLLAILFGYFRADRKNPGPNIPGQTVFTCLSHDIIAHEMTHALVDRMRHYFREPSNRDVIAFHEGFSDIVAIFQHFSFPAILRDHIQETRGDLRSPNNLIRLASEFGYATGKGQALRSAVEGKGQDGGEPRPPDASLYQKTFEPHERGSILVAAVFDAFFKTYQYRIKDLIRISTGGTGELPKGDLHPDLVNRIAAEATRTAQATLRMCIRAFEYLPPVDITFGDYLRALITADYELAPVDEFGIRVNMAEAFQARGVYPYNVTSLDPTALLWGCAEAEKLPPLPCDDPLVMRWILNAAADFSRRVSTPESSQGFGHEPSARERERDLRLSETAIEDESSQEGSNFAQVAQVLKNYVYQPGVAVKLGLDPVCSIHVHGFHPIFRVSPSGQLLIELVVQFMQRDKSVKEDFETYGGVPFRGGTTLIAGGDGTPRYVITKPLASPRLSAEKQREAKERLEQQKAFVEDCDRRDSQLAWADSAYYRNRIALNMNFSAIHSEIIR
jgi:hypothetical protein